MIFDLKKHNLPYMKMIKTTIMVMFFIGIGGLLCRCETEGFPQDYNGICGSWSIKSISGGFTGRGFSPKYDLLEIDSKMKFSLFRNDTLVSDGRITILEKTSEVLRIEMNSKNTEWSYLSGVKNVRLSSDTLLLYDDCCDLYSYLFVRKKK
jgi:hypothetical protein